MYYKIEPGNVTHEKVKDTLQKLDSYIDQSESLVKELGFERYGKSHNGVAGGISCVESSSKPEGYVSVGKKWQNLYRPKANQKEIWAKIKALPVMSFEEFGEAIGFKPQFKGLTYHRACGITTIKNTYLVEVSDKCDYTPAEGMVEILASEYKKLMALNESENE